jgi:hypothetical protein
VTATALPAPGDLVHAEIERIGAFDMRVANGYAEAA